MVPMVCIFTPPPGERSPRTKLAPITFSRPKHAILAPRFPTIYVTGEVPPITFSRPEHALLAGANFSRGGGVMQCVTRLNFFPPCKQRAHEPAVVWASVPSFVPSVGAHCGFPLHQSPVPHQHPPHRWFESHVFKFAQIFLLYIINIINIFYISIIS